MRVCAAKLTNILSLEDSVLDMVIAEHLKRKGTAEIFLKQLGGGAHPMIVNLGKYVTEGCTKILSHTEIDIIQKDLQLSVTKMRDLLRLIRAAFGPQSVKPYWRDTSSSRTRRGIHRLNLLLSPMMSKLSSRR